MENGDADQHNREHAVKKYHDVRPAEKSHQSSYPGLPAEFQWQAGESQSQHAGHGQKVNAAMQRLESKDRVIRPVGGKI